jgi:hypothetical protein
MHSGKFILVFFLTVIFIVGVGCAADVKTGSLSPTTSVESESVSKLRFVKTTLLNGPTAQDRLDAADELLYGKDKPSRQILLETLALKDNSPARQAICKTIINSRLAIPDKSDFRLPLLAILQESNEQDAKFAAQATLIFEFSEIADDLTKLITTPKIERVVRLNALYALQLRSVDKQAIATIASLTSDEDTQVAQTARQAIPYWIPAGMDGREILQYIRHLSQGEITRKWINFQEKEARRLENERLRWKTLYLSSLSREYETADDTEKGNILLSRLGSALATVRLWALEKISTLSPSVILPPEFNAQLLGVLSDSDRTVRLTAAGLFSQMSDRNPAEKLLAQFKVEEYDDIKLELFKALGEACYYAFSAGSSFKLSEEIRSATLIISEQYLSNSDSDKAAVAAGVIRKMLEPNGLEPILATKYLKLLSTRFAMAKDHDDALAAEILGEMARLCAQPAHREITSRLYGTFFLNGLIEKDNELIRRTSITGLINIDKTTALQTFKKYLLVNDPSENIRSAVMELAGQTGEPDDIKWLSASLQSNGEAAVAWEAIKEILQRQNATVIYVWADRLALKKLSQDRIMVLLTIAEKKAELENNSVLTRAIRTKLRPIQLDVYLKAGNLDKAVQIVSSRLTEGDIPAGNSLAMVIEDFMTNASLEQITALMKELTVVNATGINATSRPLFSRLVKTWKLKLNPLPVISN